MFFAENRSKLDFLYINKLFKLKNFKSLFLSLSIKMFIFVDLGIDFLPKKIQLPFLIYYA